MKKLSIEPGCITCGLCEFLVPTVFEVTDVSRIKPDAPIAHESSAIAQAAAGCPVQVIRYEDDKQS